MKFLIKKFVSELENLFAVAVIRLVCVEFKLRVFVTIAQHRNYLTTFNYKKRTASCPGHFTNEHCGSAGKISNEPN